jgi:hypothetical protein
MKKVIATAIAAFVLAGTGAGYASAAASRHEQAAGGWYALADSTDQCYAADRPAGPAEQQLAGPFKSESDASKAIGGMAGCSYLWKGD